ncbi:MAG: hypothetical protein PVI86_06250 [Phycisphaerae bacterium]|jgi:hypothetical protein
MDRPARVALTVALAGCSGLCLRADEEGDPKYAPPILESFGRLSEQMDDTAWERDTAFLKKSMDKLWERNGWTTESDLFARDVAKEVAAIPPWRVMRRLETMNRHVAERYGLSDADASRFQGAVIGETSGVLLRNMGIITRQIREVVEARQHGRPFTAEQVARWMQEGEPIMSEMEKSADRLRQVLEPMVAADRRRFFDADVESYMKRQRVVDKAVERWASGGWEPSDWGLEDDPVHRGLGKPAAALNAGRAGDAKVPKPIGRSSARLMACVSYDPESWHVCVTDLKAQLQLDPGQVDTAESIHAELVERARACIVARSDVLAAVPTAERKTHEAYEPVRALFAEFQDRLDAILTSSQRAQRDRPDAAGRSSGDR